MNSFAAWPKRTPPSAATFAAVSCGSNTIAAMTVGGTAITTAVACLEDLPLHTGIVKLAGRSEPDKSGPNDDRSHATLPRLRRRQCSGASQPSSTDGR